MATRSYICRKNEQGTYDYAYCHFDGYPEGVGRTLFENYNTTAKIKELLSFGDMSILGERIHPTDPNNHHFGYKRDNENKFVPAYEDGVCVFYDRDRGEKGTHRDPQPLDKILEDWDPSFVYVWENHYWRVHYKNGEYKALEEVLE